MDYLTQAFAIDVANYAVMSNHYHLVVRVDAERAQRWSWQEVYNGNMLSQRFISGETLPTAERKVLQSKAEVWRSRLSDISWFMAATQPAASEHIAGLANTEEGVSGMILASAIFQSNLTRRTSDTGLLCLSERGPCALNPIRAKMAETPEDSECTSIQQRIIAAEKGTVPSNLMRFQGPEIKGQEPGLPCSLKDYIELVESTGSPRWAGYKEPKNAAPSYFLVLNILSRHSTPDSAYRLH